MEYEVLNGLNEVKYLKFSSYDAITRTIYFPIRSIRQKEEQFVYYPDGNFEKRTMYTIEPYNYVDGIPLLNSYGQIMFNSYMNKKYNSKNQINNNNSINYDSL